MKRFFVKIFFTIMLSILVVGLMGCSLTDCLSFLSSQNTPQDKATVKEISLEGKTTITVGDFNFADYKLILLMSDESTKKVVLKNENISQNDLQKLSTIGKHTISITYDTIKTQVEFVINERIENTVTLSFNVDGKKAYYCDIPKDSVLTKEIANEKYLDESAGMVGYIVNKWYTDESLTTEYEFGKIETSNVNLYGKSKYIVDAPLNSQLLEKFNDSIKAKKLTILNKNELDSYVFYSIFFNVSEEQAPALKLSYLPSPTTQTIIDEFNSSITNVKTISNYNSGSEIKMTTNGNTGRLYVYSHALTDYATKTFDSKNYLYPQQKHAILGNFEKTRDNDFDNFNIENVSANINVSTSEQLVYALEMGFNPICQKNSKAEITYNKAKAILKEICNDEMTNLQKTYAIYNWLIINVQYDNLANQQSKNITGEETRKYDSWFAEGVFNEGKAVCEGFAKAFLIMAKLENIPCVYVTGNEHAWNKVYINGNWFVIDATHGNISVSHNEAFTYTQFLVTDNYKSSIGYSTTDHPEIKATTKYNFYDNIEFVYNDEFFDFDISSMREFENLVSYIKSKSISSPFVFEITIGNNLISIEKLCKKLNEQDNYSVSYSTNETVFGKTAYMIFVS